MIFEGRAWPVLLWCASTFLERASHLHYARFSFASRHLHQQELMNTTLIDKLKIPEEGNQ